MTNSIRATSSDSSVGSLLTVLVTGATGKVGRRLIGHLLADGHHVRALTRHPETAALPVAVELYTGDPTQADAVAQAARGADVAFLNWMGFDATGARASVDALAAEVGRIVYLSASLLQRGTRGVMPGVGPTSRRPSRRPTQVGLSCAPAPSPPMLSTGPRRSGQALRY